jgi:nitrate/nitrite transporter NarK
VLQRAHGLARSRAAGDLREGRRRIRDAHLPAHDDPGRPLCRRSFGAILGFTNGGGGLGGFIGPFLAGYLFDRTGTISWRSR